VRDFWRLRLYLWVNARQAMRRGQPILDDVVTDPRPGA
jgi:hypothetical protein